MPNPTLQATFSRFQFAEGRRNKAVEQSGIRRTEQFRQWSLSTIGHGLLPTAGGEQESTIELLASYCPRIGPFVARIIHNFQLSSGSRQYIWSRNRSSCRSIHCFAIQPAGRSIESSRTPQTAARAISRSDSRDGVNCAPQRGQTSFVPVPCFSCWVARLRHRDAIALIIVLIVIIALILLFIAGHPVPNCSRVCRALALVSPDIQ